MALQICSLNSGSNGNCYYIGNEKEAVLVDAGLSCRETERRMERVGLNIKKVAAILISHEHSDHIRGLEKLSARHQLPVYVTRKTLVSSRLQLPINLVRTFDAGTAHSIGSLTFVPFQKFHDAADPHSFLVSYNRVTVGVFTDIGKCCQQVKNHFAQCDAVFLESNYDEQMLDCGNYPIFLKNRIRGGHGHLSNKEALELFKSHRSPSLSHILLSHLSRENNCPQKAMEYFLPHASHTRIVVASRDLPSEVFTIFPNEGISSTKMNTVSSRQLSFF